jgi:hypothetical protein
VKVHCVDTHFAFSRNCVFIFNDFNQRVYFVFAATTSLVAMTAIAIALSVLIVAGGLIILTWYINYLIPYINYSIISNDNNVKCASGTLT